MTQLKRFTTEYIDAEDRIRLSGEVAGAAPVELWLTQRVLQRLLSVLLEWLEGRGHDRSRSEVLQCFAQQAARVEIKAQKAVQIEKESISWLVLSIAIAKNDNAVRLTLSGVGEDQRAVVSFSTKSLRQWLGILYDAYRKADWQLSVWPDWVRESTRPARPQALALH